MANKLPNEDFVEVSKIPENPNHRWLYYETRIEWFKSSDLKRAKFIGNGASQNSIIQAFRRHIREQKHEGVGISVFNNKETKTMEIYFYKMSK